MDIGPTIPMNIGTLISLAIPTHRGLDVNALFLYFQDIKLSKKCMRAPRPTYTRVRANAQTDRQTDRHTYT